MNVFIQVSDDGGKTLAPLGERWKHVDNHCHLDRPEGPELLPRRLRRRHLRELRPRRELAHQAEPAGHAVLRHDRATRAARSTTSTAARRTTTPSAARPAPAASTASPTPTGSSSRAATASTARSIRPTRTSSTASCSTACCAASTAGPAQRVRHPAAAGARASRRCAGTGTRPLIISPHNPKRLYFAANSLFRSDDRGDSWKAVSGDLTRQLDRNKLPVMGKVWGPDAVSKHVSTSFYGNCVALAESPKKEGLIYVGTDDGLIQVTEDGGKTWRKIEQVPRRAGRTPTSASSSPRSTTPTRSTPASTTTRTPTSRPYLLKSTDAGKTWTSIAGDLPDARHGVLPRRGSRRSEPAVRRHRVRPVLHARRRQEVAPHQERAADDPGEGPVHPAADERPRHRHVRPRHLRPRRLLAAAAA